MIRPNQIGKKLKPKENIPWWRIIKEHVIDGIIGGVITLWVYHLFQGQIVGVIEWIVNIIKELGGLGVIGSFIVLMHRIYFNGKKKKD